MQACATTTPCVYIHTLIYTHVSSYTMYMYDWFTKQKLCSHLGKSSQERFCILGSSLCTHQQPEYHVIFFPSPKVLRTYFQIKYTLILCNEHPRFAWSRAAALLSMISKMTAWKKSPPFHSPPLPQESQQRTPCLQYKQRRVPREGTSSFHTSSKRIPSGSLRRNMHSPK